MYWGKNVCWNWTDVPLFSEFPSRSSPAWWVLLLTETQCSIGNYIFAISSYFLDWHFFDQFECKFLTFCCGMMFIWACDSVFFFFFFFWTRFLNSNFLGLFYGIYGVWSSYLRISLIIFLWILFRFSKFGEKLIKTFKNLTLWWI